MQNNNLAADVTDKKHFLSKIHDIKISQPQNNNNPSRKEVRLKICMESASSRYRQIPNGITSGTPYELGIAILDQFSQSMDSGLRIL